MQKNLNKKRKGFTLIELIVVIAIIGILVLLAMPKFMDYTKEAKMAQIKHDVKVAETIMDEYLSIESKLPEYLDVPVMDTPLAEGRLFETRGVATAIIGDAADYRDVTTMDEVLSIRSKLPGQFVANEHGKVYYIHDKAINIGNSGDGGSEVVTEDKFYTDEEVSDLVTSGWIPVANADELNQIREDGATLTFGAGTDWEGQYVAGQNNKYVQVADIDLSSYGSGEGWNSFDNFGGSYDGGEYNITNLYINRNIGQEGLFGYFWGAELKNINLVNGTMINPGGEAGLLVGYVDEGSLRNINISNGSINTSNDYVGLMAGYIDGYWASEDIIVDDVHVDGTIDVDGTYISGIGGVVGDMDNGFMSNIYSYVDIADASKTGESFGGIVGEFYASIEKSMYSGTIIGGTKIGGVAGYTEGDASNIYSEGVLEGSGNVGGLFGQVAYSGVLSNSHSVASVSGDWGTGGIIGYGSGSFTIISSYHYNDPFNDNGTQVTEAAMADATTFSGWDFDTIWSINEKPYPTFNLGTEDGSLTLEEKEVIMTNLGMITKVENMDNMWPADINKIVFATITKAAGIEYNELELDDMVSNFDNYVSINTATTLSDVSNALIEDIILGAETVGIDPYVDWLRDWLLIYMQEQYEYAGSTLLAGSYEYPYSSSQVDGEGNLLAYQFSDSFEIGHRYSYYYEGRVLRIRRISETAIELYINDELIYTETDTAITGDLLTKTVDYVGINPNLYANSATFVVQFAESGNILITFNDSDVTARPTVSNLYIDIIAGSPIITDDSIAKVFVMHPPYKNDTNYTITAEGAIYHGIISEYVGGFIGVDEEDILNKVNATTKEELVSPIRPLPVVTADGILWRITP